ncbi:GDSL-type esterase/lipase family protein [Saccharopolyspora halophila]|uniref:GDSL-type esterase/lipase family protein n=1 Tax=Saccharopolyspora halophila TaxID=405551 RepID=A0ABN3GRS4_9PSEU
MRARNSRTLIALALAVLVGLVVLTSDLNVPERTPQPPRLPTAVVTIGDSTLSGEGAGDYERGTNGTDGNWCHRSPAAPVHQLPLPPTTTRINLACSGAKTTDLRVDPGPERSQAERLRELTERYRITDVVVAVGANDEPDFIDTVNQCVEAWMRRAEQGCSAKLRHSWPQRVEQMRPKVEAALDDIRTVLDEAGYSEESYSLILQSYASPVAPGIPPELQGLSGCPFQTRDMAWIRDTGVPQLSAGLREAARESGARFLDLSRAGHGHEACTGDPKTAEGEWFTRLTVDWESLQDDRRAPHAMQESYHPNAAGQAQIAGCLGQFMATEAPRAACLPDESGNLRAVPADETR